MKLTKTSMFSGKQHTMDLPITVEQMVRYNAGAMIQDAFPHLTADQREFIKTGVTPEEWKAMFPEEDE